MIKDALGDRMKSYYEDRYRIQLPRRSYLICRLDGAHFHSFTKGLQRPYDEKFMGVMDSAAKALCENVEGCRCAFSQSDEISLLLTDFSNKDTQAWFDNNLQKICSVSASICTAHFNKAYREAFKEDSLNENRIAYFDSRVFMIPNRVDVMNYFIWRQSDATRNAIQSAGQYYYSPKELHGKNTSDIQEMLFSGKGINFNDYPVGFKRGRMIVSEKYPTENNPEVLRNRWVVESDLPILSFGHQYFDKIIPRMEEHLYEREMGRNEGRDSALHEIFDTLTRG